MLHQTRPRIAGLFAICLISTQLALTCGSTKYASAADEVYGELARFLPDTTETIIALHPQRGSLEALAERLRLGAPPVIGRIKDDALLLDLRTVAADQETALISRLRDLSE